MLQPEALTAAAFAPFGHVLESPDAPRRDYFDEALFNGREAARPSLSFVRNEPLGADRLVVTRLECHPRSSQSFVPMNAARWLVFVAPDRAGRPDMAGARAFVAGPTQGVTYFAGTWHLGLQVFDKVSTHAIFMWRDLSSGDETFVDVEPTTVGLENLPEMTHE